MARDCLLESPKVAEVKFKNVTIHFMGECDKNQPMDVRNNVTWRNGHGSQLHCCRDWWKMSGPGQPSTLKLHQSTQKNVITEASIEGSDMSMRGEL